MARQVTLNMTPKWIVILISLGACYYVIRDLYVLENLQLYLNLYARYFPFKFQESEPQVSNQQSNQHKGAPLSNDFQLKHIFHHGAGSKYHKVHRRLDITSEYLEKNDLHNWTPLDRGDINVENLESVYQQYDWPNHYKHVNPWNASLSVKRNREPKLVRRLKERHTPGFIDSYLNYAMEVKGNPSILNRIHLDWEDDEILIPDVNDKQTLVSLALMSSNAYVRFPHDDKEKKKLSWYDVAEPWVPDQNNSGIEFGWDYEGVRGHVFVNDVNNTVVIALKGTSGTLPGGGNEDTTDNDKLNDNLLFLCCCARVSYIWTTVCDCYEKAYTCNQDCLEKELMRKDRYYQAALEIYRNVSAIYPPDTHNIWITGHSLGGSLGSLLGRTYGLPVVTFETPGEMLATKRLHLPQPPGYPKFMEHIYHIGNTADPIFMGVCNGVSSTCNAAGYAMETACHTGKLCVYDVVTDKGWSVSVLRHRIHTVIDEIIMTYNTTAECVDQPPCRDCFNWRFVTHDDDEPDEPSLPNPLIPHKPTSSSSISITPSELSTTSSNPSDKPRKQKCLDRTWYGWCQKWGYDDDDDDDAGNDDGNDDGDDNNELPF